ncbi:MAG: Fur family transcriptional regulator [Candidatus Aminicenantales bacterium]
MTQELKTFQDFLHSHTFKVTQTRKLIFKEVFATQEVHPNAYEIYRRLKKKKKTVSLATIYRTLSLLVKSGLVSQIDLGESHSHYEPDIPKSGHGHLICLSCGVVKEFSNLQIQRTIGRVGKENEFQLDKFSIQVFGYCRKCKKRRGA